jgi:hypothetical protein
VERQTGIRPEELNGPEFPSLVSHIWSAFISLSQSRSAGFNGPNPITYEQIKAWKDLTETPLDAREVEAVKSLDSVYMRTANG